MEELGGMPLFMDKEEKKSAQGERGETSPRPGWYRTRASPQEQEFPYISPSLSPVLLPTTSNCPLWLHSFKQGDLLPDQ